MRKTLAERLDTATRCYQRNIQKADNVRMGSHDVKHIRRLERAAERAWQRAEGIRSLIARERFSKQSI